MKYLPAIWVVSMVVVAGPSALLADDMTEDKCVKAFLAQPTKDWKGYDNCRREASQLKLRDSNGMANRNMLLPPANTQPAAAGSAPGQNTR